MTVYPAEQAVYGYKNIFYRNEKKLGTTYSLLIGKYKLRIKDYKNLRWGVFINNLAQLTDKQHWNKRSC